jgi:hypothetical protein
MHCVFAKQEAGGLSFRTPATLLARISRARPKLQTHCSAFDEKRRQ